LYGGGTPGRRAPSRVLLVNASPLSRRRRFSVRVGKTRPQERSYRSQLGFCPFFNEANEHPRRATRPQRAPSKPRRPQKRDANIVANPKWGGKREMRPYSGRPRRA
jgi:hypothetical protein